LEEEIGAKREANAGDSGSESEVSPCPMDCFLFPLKCSHKRKKKAHQLNTNRKA